MSVEHRAAMRAEYGEASPEYAAAVYEDLLDARYERRALLDAEIEGLAENLEREKREIRIQRKARARARQNAELDA
jgi:hypothetical protein